MSRKALWLSGSARSRSLSGRATPARSRATWHHSYANSRTHLARFSLVVFEPGVGCTPRPEACDA